MKKGGMNGRLSFTLRLCAVLIFMHASTRGCCRPEPMHHNESFVSLMMHKKSEVVKGGAESENRPTEVKTKVPLLEMQALRMRVFSCSRIIPAEEAQARRAEFSYVLQADSNKDQSVRTGLRAVDGVCVCF